MDKFNGYVQDNSGNLNTAGTATVHVYLTGTTTDATIYSSDSLGAGTANPFTLPASGLIGFHARNGVYDIVVDGVTLFSKVHLAAPTLYGTFAARPAAGSADRRYIATDTGVEYYDNGSAWKDIRDFTLTGLSAKEIANSMASAGYTMLNGTLVSSVAANALTVAIKTLAGTDPSTTDPVFVLFRSATAATGDYSVIKITAATSFTVSAGSTLGQALAQSFRLWVVGFNDAGTFRLGLINCVSATAGSGPGVDVQQIYPLGSFATASSTAEGGAGGADSAAIFYTGTAVTSKAYAILGHMTWEGGLATAGNYSSGPTRTELFHRGVPLPGAVIQRRRTSTGAVATGSTVLPNDDTIPQSSEGDQYMSQAITVVTGNVIRVEALAYCAITAGGPIGYALFQDVTANATVAGHTNPSANIMEPCRLEAMQLAQPASPTTTFKFRAGPSSAATLTFNGASSARKYGGVCNSYLTVEEIQG